MKVLEAHVYECTNCQELKNGVPTYLTGDPFGLSPVGGDGNDHPYCKKCAAEAPTLRLVKRTPSTLSEAIADGRESEAETENTVRDFLAQAFSVALIDGAENSEAVEILKTLWKRITGRNL